MQEQTTSIEGGSTTSIEWGSTTAVEGGSTTSKYGVFLLKIINKNNNKKVWFGKMKRKVLNFQRSNAQMKTTKLIH